MNLRIFPLFKLNLPRTVVRSQLNIQEKFAYNIGIAGDCRIGKDLSKTVFHFSCREGES
jgi:hypothetical protein